MDEDEYELVRKSKLRYKGEKKKNKKTKKVKSLDQTDGSHKEKNERALDADKHGDWWAASKTAQIRGDVAIEFMDSCYAKALDNGRIVLGQAHETGDGPDEEEIFTALGAGADKVAFKSGYGKYLGIDERGRLMGLSEAIGELETFAPVWENNKLALCAQNLCFLGPDLDSKERQMMAQSSKVGPNEICCLRLTRDPLAS